MSVFEKVEPEPIELEPIELEEEPSVTPSCRQWPNEMLVVQYPGPKKAVLLAGALVMLPVCSLFMELGLLFELVVVAAVAIIGRLVVDCIGTRNITLFPDKIVRNGYFGQIILPAATLQMVHDEQKVSFFHGTERNFRESIRIRRIMVPAAEIAHVVQYVSTVYGISDRTGGAATGKNVNRYALGKYDEAASSYRSMGIFLIVIALIAFFSAAIADDFSGLAPELPAMPARLIASGIAVVAYFVLRKLATAGLELSEARVPVEARFKQAQTRANLSALVPSVVAFLALVLFFLFGNMLDFYLFFLVALFYFFDFFPRFSSWEGSLKPRKAEETAAAVVAPRRSLQVSLVLMGALAVASQGETRHYLYANRQDCLNDWGDGKDCQEAPTGSSHYGTRYYYGPRYGSGTGRVTRSVGVGTVSRGGFGSLGSFHASFGG